jgi:hypothetical protein
LSVAALCGLTPCSHAGDLFKRLHGGCCETTVQLPPQRVLVEAPAPRVSFQESVRVATSPGLAFFAAPVMPAAIPFAGLGLRFDAPADVADEGSSLRSFHAADIAQLRYERAQAIARAEAEAGQRVLSRMAAPAPATRSASTDLDQRIKDLGDKVEKLCDRVTAVERLILTHDKYLKEQIQKNSTMPPASDGARP